MIIVATVALGIAFHVHGAIAQICSQPLAFNCHHTTALCSCQAPSVAQRLREPRADQFGQHDAPVVVQGEKSISMLTFMANAGICLQVETANQTAVRYHPATLVRNLYRCGIDSGQ
jgi:hypothetical protein